jgi:hypothetical protein
LRKPVRKPDQAVPLKVEAASSAITTSAMVMRRSRTGVSQLKRLFASQLRVPVAAAAAVIAVIMHWAHTAAIMSAGPQPDRCNVALEN